MWFKRAIAEFEGGVRLPVIVDLGDESIHATTFFDYFEDAPIFNTYDLILDREPQITLDDILNAISKKETEEDFTTA